MSLKTDWKSRGCDGRRAPGTVAATFLAPVELLKKAGLWELVQAQYSLY